MTQIDNKYKVKKGLEVTGDSSLLGNLTVTGDVNIPTLPQTENSTKAATTAFVKQAVSDLVNAAPGTLDTLNELAAALGDDPAFATTVTNNLALKAPLDSPALTGTPTAPTATTTANTTQLATTAFVQAQKASPAFTGTPTAPTAAANTNTTQIATTAFVLGQAGTANPLMNGTTAVGVSNLWSRQDHVHPSDTTKANLSGATFTGAIVANADVKLGSGSFLRNPTDNLFIQTDTAAKDIIFRTSANTERARIKDAGRVLIGTATDNATDLLQVAGAVSATIFKGSANLTGTPTAPTPAANNNSTQIATTAYVDAAAALKANASNPTFTGDAVFTGGVGSSDFVQFAFVGGGRYTTSTATITGAFKISLPVLYVGSMISFDLVVYEAASNASFILRISGYNSASNTWANTSVSMLGDVSSKIPNVRFGNDGTKSCVWVGDTGTTWATPQMSIINLLVGYGSMNGNWDSGWSIAPVTVLDTVKVGPLVPLKAAGIDSPILTGTPKAPTPSAGDNSTRIATTAYVDAADALKAPLASPALTGTPTAPTAVSGTNTTQIATTEFVSTAISNLIAASPGALDTLNELAAALGDDPAFATTMTNNLALKAPLASPALTGVPTAPTAAVDTNTTQVATTAYVVGQGYAKVSDGYAKLASPVLTGTPTAPTAANGTNTTQLATTQFVQNTLGSTLTKSVAGGSNVVLTAAEALNKTIIFTGALTANITVTFPTAGGTWTIVNSTSGAFTITLKMASGATVVVAQGYNNQVVSTGVDMILARTDFTSVYLSGTPTATTATATDNTTRVATTAFVKAQNYISASSTIDGGSF